MRWQAMVAKGHDGANYLISPGVPARRLSRKTSGGWDDPVIFNHASGFCFVASMSEVVPSRWVRDLVLPEKPKPPTMDDDEEDNPLDPEESDTSGEHDFDDATTLELPGPRAGTKGDDATDDVSMSASSTGAPNTESTAKSCSSVSTASNKRKSDTDESVGSLTKKFKAIDMPAPPVAKGDDTSSSD